MNTFVQMLQWVLENKDLARRISELETYFIEHCDFGRYKCLVIEGSEATEKIHKLFTEKVKKMSPPKA